MEKSKRFVLAKRRERQANLVCCCVECPEPGEHALVWRRVVPTLSSSLVIVRWRACDGQCACSKHTVFCCGAVGLVVEHRVGMGLVDVFVEGRTRTLYEHDLELVL